MTEAPPFFMLPTPTVGVGGIRKLGSQSCVGHLEMAETPCVRMYWEM